MKKRSKGDGLEYYQIISKDGLVDASKLMKMQEMEVPKVKIPNKSVKEKYTFTGNVYRYENCLIRNYCKSTMAVSEAQARNNILYAAKLKCNLSSTVGGFRLDGKLEKK